MGVNFYRYWLPGSIALHFVLARGIGQAFTSADVPPEAVMDLLRDEGCGA